MRRHTGPAITILACLGALLWAAAAPAAQTPPAAAPARSTVVVLEDQGVVPPNATRGFTRFCPKRAPRPVGGTFGPGAGAPLAGQFLLAASYPTRERRAWRVVVKNITPLAQSFFAGAVCLGADVPVVYPQTTGVAAPGADAGAQLRCPASAPRGIGGFFRPQQTSATGQLAGDGSFRTGGRLGHGDPEHRADPARDARTGAARLPRRRRVRRGGPADGDGVAGPDRRGRAGRPRRRSGARPARRSRWVRSTRRRTPRRPARSWRPGRSGRARGPG